MLAMARATARADFVFCSSSSDGSACGPVIVPVFKTGGWQAILSPVGSTPTRFRHLFLIRLPASAIFSQSETVMRKSKSVVNM
jgi:hypothetical protein